ncbi:MAG: hypothetical protein ACI9J3_001062 [Parvicellaceae bacterium]|jgi:hypothetical protein
MTLPTFSLVRYWIVISFILVARLVQAQDFSLSISHASGIYQEDIEVAVSGTFEKVYYSLDGSNPKNGSRYKKPIKINKNTVLRLIPFHNGVRVDSVFFRSYIFNFETKLPIVSIALEDSSLWSAKSGIYVKGNNARYDDSTEHWVHCNFQEKWEKEMQVEYIDTSGKSLFNQIAGIRIFGETTRRQPEKSMKIVARSEYGVNRFSGSVFPLKPHLDEHKQFVLRVSGNDYRGTRFKDCLNAYLVRDLGLDYMAYQPVQLFINGNYWGLYNLREKVNKHYLCYNRNADMDSSSIIMGRWVRQHGTAKDYMRMYRYFEKLDTIDNKAYRKAKEMLDIRNYINFRTSQIFLNNSDSRGNIRYWNTKDGDGKFRMIFYDTDHSYGSYDRKYLQGCLSTFKTNWYNPKWSTMYLTKLMQHPEFKADFINQFAHLLNTKFHPDTINAAVDIFVDLYKNELPRDRSVLPKQFKNSAMTEEKWLKKVSTIRKYAHVRSKHLYKEINRLLTGKGTYVLKVEGDSGQVIINGNQPVQLPYKGVYFKGVKLPVKMYTNKNWEFDSWSDSSLDSVRLIIGKSDTIVLIPKMNYIPTVVPLKDSINEANAALIKLGQSESSEKINYLLYLGYLLILIGSVLVVAYLLKKR